MQCGDNSEFPQRYVLKAISELEGGGPCVLGDINGHVSRDVQCLLDAAERDARTPVEKAQCHAQQLEVLLKAPHSFPRQQTAWCYMHNRRCPVNVLGALSLSQEQLSTKSMYMHDDDDDDANASCVRKRRRTLQPQSSTTSTVADETDAWWYTALQAAGNSDLGEDGCSEDVRRKKFLKAVRDSFHKADSDQDGSSLLPHGEFDILQESEGNDSKDETPEPWLASWGSTPCTAYAGLGHRAMEADPTERPHNIFIGERCSRTKDCSEDFYWFENSNLYPFEKKQGVVLEESHTTVHIKADGVMLGYPYHRPRTLGFGFNREKFQWMGSPDPQAQFEEIFSRSVQTTGDIYFQADKADVETEYREMARSRGYNLPRTFAFDDIEVLTKVLPPGAVARCLEWAGEREEKQSLSGVFIADLDHHPKSGPTAGPYYPSMPTHSTTFSFSQQRLHLGLEAFMVHGLVTSEEHAAARPSDKCKFLQVLKSLPRRHQETLVGNSLLAPVVSAWLVFCLSNLQARCDATTLPPRMRASASGSASRASSASSGSSGDLDS